MAETIRMGGETSADDRRTLAMPRGRARRAMRQCPGCLSTYTSDARFCPFDGAPLIERAAKDRAADPLVGRALDGRYEILDVLGEGGMGTVYVARHLALDRRFAVKVLRREVAEQPDAVERFLQEARAAASIGHENIVLVSDFGTVLAGDAGSPVDLPYFVMELLEGESLSALLKRARPLAPERAARIVLACADGLEAAHQAGVIHRDLKPDNVHVSARDGVDQVTLVDFGIAKVAGTSKLTKRGMVYGTPHYMSPEQASGSPVDHRADIYALGVILYECLSGRVPFEADTFMGVLTQHMFAEPRPLELVMEEGRSGPLEAIVMRCLAKSPADRYASMAELGEALRAALGDAGAVAEPRPSRPAARLALREAEDPLRSAFPRSLPDPTARRWPRLLALVAIALAAGFVALISWGGGPEPAGPQPWRDVDAVAPPAAAESSVVAGPPIAGDPAPAAPRAIELAPPAAPVASGLRLPRPGASPAQKSPTDGSTVEPPPPSPPADPPTSSEIVDPWD